MCEIQINKEYEWKILNTNRKILNTNVNYKIRM